MKAVPRRIQPALLGCIGVLLLLLTWEVIGATGLLGNAWPPLSDVLSTLGDGSRRAVFGRALSATTGAAARGFVLGTILAVLLAMVAVAVPALDGGIQRLAAVLHAVPVVALGPLFIVTLGREGTPVAISTLAVLFTTFVAAVAGFGSPSAGHHDLLSVLGARRSSRFARLQLPAALPALLDGAKLGAPAAVLGAILGEWFGAPRGLGSLIVSAMQNYQIELLWSAALLGALISVLAYATLSAAERWIATRFRP